ncbi:large ribosomal subunit protein mL46-like [Brachionichthys hirsutus]|uniref:large ribosomal subunit protein mL46-like n=2 Tax=Brachionichthys hirsutus TaxID=412623 RepID=UPI0036048A36
MAAPCRRVATRSVLRFLSCCSGTAVRNTGCRPFFSASVCAATCQTKDGVERATAPWTLVAAVCLQRLPVVSADCTLMEQRFKDLMCQMELEKSVMSDHELRILEDAERRLRQQANDYDSDEEDGHGDQDILLAQDLDDMWEQKLKSFQPALRVRADVDKDLTSPERCLADSLLLLAEQQVGSEKLWLLPQTQWQEGETLRQTAERALTSLPVAGIQGTFLSNAPCGVYKYKLPSAVRTEDSAGTKVFFFKAFLSGQAPLANTHASFQWVKKSELQGYLKPAYMQKVNRFILCL